jgi:hypothetical protein
VCPSTLALGVGMPVSGEQGPSSRHKNGKGDDDHTGEPRGRRRQQAQRNADRYSSGNQVKVSWSRHGSSLHPPHDDLVQKDVIE